MTKVFMHFVGAGSRDGQVLLDSARKERMLLSQSQDGEQWKQSHGGGVLYIRILGRFVNYGRQAPGVAQRHGCLVALKPGIHLKGPERAEKSSSHSPIRTICLSWSNSRPVPSSQRSWKKPRTAIQSS